MTTQDRAREMYNAFETAKRASGEEYQRLKEDAPQWMKDVCREAHQDGSAGGMLPDDYRYAFIVECLGAIAGAEDVDEAQDSLEADIYTSELTGWLHSHNARHGYCDDAIAEWGIEVKDTISLLQLGQLQEKREVFGLLVRALESVALAA